MLLLDAALALLALSQLEVVLAQEQFASSSSVAQIVPPVSLITSLVEPPNSHGRHKTSSGHGRPSEATQTAIRSPIPPLITVQPDPHRPVGLVTTAYVTATIINQIEVISICSNDGATTTIIQEQATCETYTTYITIPASLCSTYVSTRSNGDLTTCITPVETWTQILPTAVTSKVQTSEGHGANTAAPSGVKPAQNGSFGNASSLQSGGKAGAQKASSTPHSPAAAQKTYTTAGASRLVASSFAICITFIIFALA